MKEIWFDGWQNWNLKKKCLFFKVIAHILLNYEKYTNKGGMGHRAVYYTSPQSIKIMFSYSLVQQLWGLLLILIGWFIKLSCQMFQPLIVIYRRGNFVYHDCGSTKIYQTLSYPFRSLTAMPIIWLIGLQIQKV